MAIEVVSSLREPQVFLDKNLQIELIKQMLILIREEVPPSFFALPLRDFSFLLLMRLFRDKNPTPSVQIYAQFVDFVNKFFCREHESELQKIELELFSLKEGSPLLKALRVIRRSASPAALEEKASCFLGEEIFIQDSLEFRAQYVQEYTGLINFYLDAWGHFYQSLMGESMSKMEELKPQRRSDKKSKTQGKNQMLAERMKKRLGSRKIDKGIETCLNLAKRLIFPSELNRIRGGARQCDSLWNGSNSMMCLWCERLIYLKQVNEKELKKLTNSLPAVVANIRHQSGINVERNKFFHDMLVPQLTNAALFGLISQSREGEGANEIHAIANGIENNIEIASNGVEYIQRLLELAIIHLDALGLVKAFSIEADAYRAVMEVTPETPDTHVPFLGKKEKASQRNSSKPANKKNKKGRKSHPIVKKVKVPAVVVSKSDLSLKLPSVQMDIYEAYGVTLLERAHHVIHSNEELRGFIRNSYKNAAYHFQALCQAFAIYKKIISEGSYFYLPVLVTQLSLHEHKVFECLFTAELAETLPSKDALEGCLTHDLSELNDLPDLESISLADLWSRYPYYYQWLNTSRIERLEHLLSKEESFDLVRHEKLFTSIQNTLTILCGEKASQAQINAFTCMDSSKMQQPQVKLEQMQNLENKIMQERSGGTIDLCEKERVQMDLAYCDALWHLERLDLALKLMHKFPEYNTVHSSGLIFHMQFFLEQYYVARCIREGKGVIRCGHNLEHFTQFVASIDQNFLHDLNVGTMTSYLDWSDDPKSNKPYANYALRNGFELNRTWHQQGEKMPHMNPNQFNTDMQEFVLEFLKTVEPIISKPVNFISV